MLGYLWFMVKHGFFNPRKWALEAAKLRISTFESDEITRRLWLRHVKTQEVRTRSTRILEYTWIHSRQLANHQELFNPSGVHPWPG